MYLRSLWLLYMAVLYRRVLTFRLRYLHRRERSCVDTCGCCGQPVIWADDPETCRATIIDVLDTDWDRFGKVNAGTPTRHRCTTLRK